MEVVTVAHLPAVDPIDVDKDVMRSRLQCCHDMGMVGFPTVSIDFLRDTLLWAKLIDKYCVRLPPRAWQS